VRRVVAAACIGATVALSCVSGAAPSRGDDEIPKRLADMARLSPPIPRLATVRPDTRALAKGMRVVYPGFVGDAVLASLPPRRAGPVAGSAVYRQSVAPLLRALRAPVQTELRVPNGTGRPLRGASLAGLASIACRDFEGEAGPRGARELCAVMRGEKPSTREIDATFLGGEGLTFAQFKADLERRRIQYVFPQVVGNVPVEHAGLIASRWQGESVTLVHGAVFTRFAIVNKPALTPAAAAALAARGLGRIRGVRDVSEPGELRELVLLPGGRARDRLGRIAPAFRYVYRTLLFGFVTTPDGRIERVSWLAWVDAASGRLLKLLPQYHFVSGVGGTWRRAPDVATATSFFEVDPAAGGQYTLQLDDGTAPVLRRIDRLGNGVFTDGEVSISSSAGGSSATFANFDQAPVNNGAGAVCQSGGNDAYRQVNAFAQLYAARSSIAFAGTIPSFPEAAINVRVDAPGDSNFAIYDSGGTGQSMLNYSVGAGFSDPACANAPGKKLNGAQESPTLVHELAHLSTARLQERRPATWCGTATCPMPSGALTFHDFADTFANSYASTACIGGWVRRNQGGAGVTANCTGPTSEGGALPRLAQLTVPFDPLAPADHFPEHRALATGDYADGQIAAAALWSVRQGMRSKCLASGTPQFFVRLVRALWNFGFSTAATCSGCDRDVYRPLQDLLRQLVQQWATSGQPGGPPGFAHNGAHTTNKVTSGFARAGVFLVPDGCIDGDTATSVAGWCPGGENGGDAVVDIDDNDQGDDVTIDGVVHPERDYIRRAGPVPTFLVWTGPRYKFDASGNARTFTPSAATPAPCYVQYRVELSTSPTFSGTVVTSTPSTGALRTVSTTASPGCFATWTPTQAEWDSLKGVAGDVRVHYRVRTRGAAGSVATERISTRPGNGLYAVPAPYAIVRDSGTP
jgi:hypothetical protein